MAAEPVTNQEGDRILRSRPRRGIVVLELNDPLRLNALSPEMGEELRAASAELATDPDLRAVILRGRGGSFSAGGTLDMLQAHVDRASRGEDTRGRSESFYASFASVRDIGVPVVAAVEGSAIGAGLGLALLADLMVLSEEARLGFTFTRIGLHPGMLATQTVVRACGLARATELLTTGRTFGASDAVAYGLALETTVPGGAYARALDLALEIAAAAPLAVRQVITTLRAADAGFADTMMREASCQAENYAGAEIREGLDAVRERRAPRFATTEAGV